MEGILQMSFEINEFTICLHCGCKQDIVDAQMEALKPLEDKYKITWNNRIDRYPHTYPSYSQLINHSVVTSPTEFVILINDRTYPKVHEVEKMIEHMKTGFACSFMYNVGFMMFAKELIRKIGWWDERFKDGGWEDRDWVWRLALANLALYESQEGEYDYTWKSPLNVPGGKSSTPHWLAKYRPGIGNQGMYKILPEETYQHWDLFLGDPRPDISSTWKPFIESILNIGYDKEGSGPSASALLRPYGFIKDVSKQ